MPLIPLYFPKILQGEPMLARRLPALLLLPFSCAFGESKVDRFDVTATIQSGCVMASNSNTAAHLGTIDFGVMADLGSQVDVASTIGSGSIVLTCTPGATVNIGINNGLHSTGAQRYLKHEGGNTRLAYALFQKSDYSTVWGTQSQAMTIPSFPPTTQIYTVYARLFATGMKPPPGTYTDTVTVTLTY